MEQTLATSRYAVLDIDEVCVVVGLLDVLARSSDAPIARLARKYESLIIHRAEPGGDHAVAPPEAPLSSERSRPAGDFALRLAALRRAYNTLVDENIRVRTKSELVLSESADLRRALRDASELVGSRGPAPGVPEGDERLARLRDAFAKLAA